MSTRSKDTQLRSNDFDKSSSTLDPPGSSREGLEVVKDLVLDDDVEVGMKVNFKAISSEYGGDLLETMVVLEVQTMGVGEVATTDIVFFNLEKVVGEAYQASTDQTTTVSVKEQTMEVEKTEDEASQFVYLHASAYQITVVSVEEQTIEVAQTEVVIFHHEEDVDEASQSKESKVEVVEGKDDDNGNLQNKLDPEQVIKEMAVDQTNLILMESEVDVTLKKRHAITKDEINERAFKMACRMNQLHAHLGELLSGVLVKSFIQRPISQDEKK
ncbi:hypothetical protein GIB67_003264 [Kingdonia uniflora]|uniref:Uncharacterized protein n=1 Tax=Kingdonia uniflora TaxID=39325 RepID=A0A7J7LXI0_9MAGN|nr:hypothetical protein GIB67_003264 [Kingdonia uniflora]